MRKCFTLSLLLHIINYNLEAWLNGLLKDHSWFSWGVILKSLLSFWQLCEYKHPTTLKVTRKPPLTYYPLRCFFPQRRSSVDSLLWSSTFSHLSWFSHFQEQIPGKVFPITIYLSKEVYSIWKILIQLNIASPMMWGVWKDI